MGNINASVEGAFIKEHINEFYNLNQIANEFENHLLKIEQKDTALKYIDKYSLAIEKALSVYDKFKTSDNPLIAMVSTDLTKLLSDIMDNNYQLLDKLLQSELSNSDLKQECASLVAKDKFISNFLRDVSLGICASTVKERPKKSSSKEQFSLLTEKERNQINELLVQKFGNRIKTMKKEDSKSSYEYSCVTIYEFLNMKWKFEKER